MLFRSAFAQLNNTGTNYWNPSTPYLSTTVANAPAQTDIIGLSAAGTSTITFSQPVTDPLIALVSWNGADVTFNAPIVPLSSGCGFWGCGSFANVTSDQFTGSGELHGVLEVVGTETPSIFRESHELIKQWLPQAEELAIPQVRHGLEYMNAHAVADGRALFFASHNAEACSEFDYIDIEDITTE